MQFNIEKQFGFTYNDKPLTKNIINGDKYRITILNSRLVRFEYSEYEFDLIPIPPYEFIESNIVLEPYEYFGNVAEIFELRVKHIIMYFNADILMRIEYYFNGNLTEILKSMIEQLISYELPEYMTLILRKDKKFTVLMYQNKALMKH